MHQAAESGGFLSNLLGLCLADTFAPFNQARLVGGTAEDSGYARKLLASPWPAILASNLGLGDAFWFLMLLMDDEHHVQL